MKNKYIYLVSIIICLILYVIEQMLQVNYLVKTMVKISLFILVPLIYVKWIKRKAFIDAFNLKKIKSKDLKLGVILGLLSFFIVLVAYYIFKTQIDLNHITTELNKSNITTSNFIFIGLYISFINSFLEEFFFRGFIFLNLYENTNKKTAYLFSAFLFALYHIAIFKTWFSLPLTLLALLGLLVIGLIFNYLDTLSKNFLNSWMVHILADAGVILIGLRLFQIL